MPNQTDWTPAASPATIDWSRSDTPNNTDWSRSTAFDSATRLNSATVQLNSATVTLAGITIGQHFEDNSTTTDWTQS